MKYINIFHASNVYNNALLNLAIQLSNGHHRCKYSSRSFLFVSLDVVSSGHRNARQIVSLNLHLHSTVAVHRSSQLLYTTALEPSETSCEHAICGVETEVERTTRAAPMSGGIAPPPPVASGKRGYHGISMKFGECTGRLRSVRPSERGDKGIGRR